MQDTGRTIQVLVVSVMLAGPGVLACTGSAYESCQLAATLEPNRFSRESKLARCEQIANREYAENVRRDDMHRQEAAEQRTRDEQERARRERLQQVNSERARQVRASPKSPEVGGTPAESDALCRMQGGYQTEHPAKAPSTGIDYVCHVGGLAIYVAHVAVGAQTFERVTVWYEGRDIAATRRHFDERMGPADQVDIQYGYRRWLWNRQGIELRGYSGGVRVTTREVGPTTELEDDATSQARGPDH